jgi:ribosomal protein S18 acetylase RimI-like enzyme
MEVRQITAEETRDLRFRVLWPHLESVDKCVIDIDHRSDALHLGTFDGNRLVAIGSLFEFETPKISHLKKYRLRAMATDPEYRGKGTGEMLIRKAIEILRSKNYDVLWCDARLKAVGFYEKIGFQALDEIYEVPIIGPHKFMFFEL